MICGIARLNLEEETQNHPEVDFERSDDVHPPNRHIHIPSLIYEKDQVGFVFSDGKVEVLSDSTDISSDTENTFLSPLLTNGQAIGAVQITPRPNRQLTEDQILVANAITQQASLQIENLRLLATAERSRAEAESATRRFIHESWDSYLDAIHQSQRVGYEYDQASVFPNTHDLQVRWRRSCPSTGNE